MTKSQFVIRTFFLILISGFVIRIWLIALFGPAPFRSE
jgi:hypothetical protein